SQRRARRSAARRADRVPRRRRAPCLPRAADRDRRLARSRQGVVARVPRAEGVDRRAVALRRPAPRLGGGAGGRVNGPAVPLADVAREAGTSAWTGSRELSGRGYVAPDVRKRLLPVADGLGYLPTLSARTLKKRTSRVVGVVVSELGNQFYAALAAGVEQTLREANYQMLLLGDNSDVAQELKGVRTFLSMRP